jgi:hypothetical protein
MRKASTHELRMRTLIAQEAAKIMQHEGHRDFGLAKRKAAERLGAPSTRNLPSNQDVEDALIDYQRLFGGDDQAHHLTQLRKIAIRVMDRLQRFEPRLTGSVLSGSATQHSEIDIHLFADTPEEVIFALLEQGVTHETAESRLRNTQGEHIQIPRIRVELEHATVDLFIFPRNGLRQAPRSLIDGKPMERASREAVANLLQNNEARISGPVDMR